MYVTDSWPFQAHTIHINALKLIYTLFSTFVPSCLFIKLILFKHKQFTNFSPANAHQQFYYINYDK